MELVRIGANKLRTNLGGLIDQVQRSECDVIVTRYIRPIVAIIPYQDYLAMKDALDTVRREREQRGSGSDRGPAGPRGAFGQE